MIAVTEIDDDLLPDSLKPIADLIGLPATISLVESYGGVRIYIPRSPGEDHPLVQRIGLEAAESLARIYDGEPVELPMASAALRDARDRELLRRADEGCSINALAQEFGLSRRQVFRILSRLRRLNPGDARHPD
ncbi:MAG: Mor transcription activator family protein [Gammaproteobacteria bacterium]